MRARPAFVGWNNGEISELAQARIDLDTYPRSLSRCLNFIPLRQGGITRRPGTRYVAEVRNSARAAYCMPFIFSDDDAVLLVFNDGYIRFFTDHGPVESSPGVPYEIAHPWADVDLFTLAFVQSADVLYVCHEGYHQQVISRFGNTNWTVTQPTFNAGPFLDENVDTSLTMSFSARTGSGVTVTLGGAGYFDPLHVGSLFLVNATSLACTGLSPWEPSTAYTTGDRAYYNGRVYLNTVTGTAAKSGTVAPIHDEAERWDGKEGVNIKWNFESSLYGIFRVTAFTDANHVTATIIKTIPFPIASNPSDNWAEGAWNDLNGYPSAVTFYQDRLCFAGTTGNPDTVDMSASGDYLNFAARDTGGLVTSDLAIRVTVSSQAVNIVRQMVPDGAGLYCLTTGGAFLIAPSTNNEPLGPGNVRAIPQTTLGAAMVRPARSGPVTLSIQKGGTVVLANVYTYDNDRYKAGDTNILNPEILLSGVVQMDYAQEPHSILWIVLGDGTLAALTYDQEQDLQAWSRHELGGADAVAESLAVIPSPDGVFDDPWMIVQRTIDGASVRYVEYLDGSWPINGDVQLAYYVDSGITFDRWNKNGAFSMRVYAPPYVAGTVGVLVSNTPVFGAGPGELGQYAYVVFGFDKRYRVQIGTIFDSMNAAVTLITDFPDAAYQNTNVTDWAVSAPEVGNLDHLEGQIVNVWADGAYHPDCVVSGGIIVLGWPASYVQAGLPEYPYARTVRPEAGAQDGTAQGSTKRNTQPAFRIYNSLAFKFGGDAGISYITPLRNPAMPMSGPVTPFTGNTKRQAIADDYNSNGWVYMTQDQAAPLTILGMLGILETAGT